MLGDHAGSADPQAQAHRVEVAPAQEDGLPLPPSTASMHSAVGSLWLSRSVGVAWSRTRYATMSKMRRRTAEASRSREARSSRWRRKKGRQRASSIAPRCTQADKQDGLAAPAYPAGGRHNRCGQLASRTGPSRAAGGRAAARTALWVLPP